MTVVSGSLEDAVRAHLRAGTSGEEFARRRRRLFRDSLLAAFPLLTSLAFGQFGQAGSAMRSAVVGLGILLPASFAYRYWRIRRGPRDVVPESEVVKVA